MFQERKRVSFLVAVALAALIVLPNGSRRNLGVKSLVD